MQFLQFEGTPYEIGRQKGQQSQERITAWVQSMYEWWERDWGATAEVLKPVCERLRANSERMYPELLQEMDGIAAGCGLSGDQILLLNHYGYLWSTLGAQPGAAECTSVGYVAGPDGPLLGQNLDIGGGDYYFCELSRPTTGYATLSDGWYGMCYSDAGINEHGLSVGTSALGFRPYLSDDVWETGVENHFFTRLVLRNCKTTAEAVEYLKQTGPMIAPRSGKTYLLVDPSGDIAVVERTQNTAAVRREHVGVMATANCVLHPEAIAIIANASESEQALLLNSYNRHARIYRLFEEADRQGSLDLMRKTLRWHEMPGALCRHEGSDPTGYTAISMIAIPRQLKLMIVVGNPCKVEYETFSL